ncbi:hypothetical protein OTK49_20945 [Vibrio coralliirubri]|uniref:hypothetical protein n=1 Tax=Vibrio coralliirubri TaxID=1516159 RepID=UPI002283C4BC|nr:hypothetical protein [Vibrio coralliirubri]MCY9864987.1 hypothetical protein [Vibrio coralliirubri]
MNINDTVIVFCGKTGDIIKIGKLKSVDMEYFWTTYHVDEESYSTALTVNSKPKFIVITEKRQNEILRHCAAAYAEYVSKLTRFMMSKIADEDYNHIISSLGSIEDLLMDRVKEMELDTEVERVKRIWNLSDKKPDQYNITDEISLYALEKDAKAIAKRTTKIKPDTD